MFRIFNFFIIFGTPIWYPNGRLFPKTAFLSLSRCWPDFASHFVFPPFSSFPSHILFSSRRRRILSILKKFSLRFGATHTHLRVKVSAGLLLFFRVFALIIHSFAIYVTGDSRGKAFPPVTQPFGQVESRVV